ncbi:MAG: dihydrodipicolinate synthase family protein [Promethearchaeota archaeon]
MCNAISFYNHDFEILKDLNSLLIRHILTNEASSILLFGNFTQKDIFSLVEKIKLIELASDITESKIPLLIGIYGEKADDIINQIEDLRKKFELLNFIISPPTSERKSEEQLNAYFENILGSLTSKNQIYIINNPKIFAGNEISPDMINQLMKFSNLKGLNDSFYNIKNCKSYIENLGSDFTVICGLEQNFQAFLQLIPLKMRKYSAILSNLSNLVNLCSKLYSNAIQDNILEVLQLQEQINGSRKNLYEIRTNEVNEDIGLKYSFLHIYKDLVSRTSSNISSIYKELQNQIDPISVGRIEATVNSLMNHKQIYKLYFLGKQDLYQFDEIIKTFSQIEILVNQGKVKKIKGPYTTDINTLYRVNFEKNQLVFRFRTDQYLLFDNLIKEKLLYPFLDKTLSPNDINLRQNVKEILASKKGSYFFDKENPPIIPVCNLFYYDETKEIIPYVFSVQEYIRGKPLFQLINRYISEGKNLQSKKFADLFSNLGEKLAKLHTAKFDSFFYNIFNIGKKEKLSYSEYISLEFEDKIKESYKNKLGFSNEVQDYYKEHSSLFEDITEFTLIHNDLKSQNIIVKEELGAINIKGIVDFDNWCVGTRAQDFVKIDYWILKPLNNPSFNSAFYNSYSKSYKLDNDFKKKIELYKLLWLLSEFNFESELIKKSVQIDFVENQSKSLNNYIEEIKAIIQ